MIYPNKHIRFDESVIYKMVEILALRDENEIGIHELYVKTKNKFKNIDEFIYSLDVLYIMDMIYVDFENKNIGYVKRD